MEQENHRCSLETIGTMPKLPEAQRPTMIVGADSTKSEVRTFLGLEQQRLVCGQCEAMKRGPASTLSLLRLIFFQSKGHYGAFEEAEGQGGYVRNERRGPYIGQVSDSLLQCVSVHV